MNKITILFFAILKDKAGTRELDLEVKEGTRVIDLKEQLSLALPGLAGSLRTVLVAVNQEFAFDDDLIPAGAEVGLFPPVSGGSGPAIRVDVVRDDLDLNQLLSSMVTRSTGALCIFSGIVRGETTRGNAHQTISLEYEAYLPMAIKKMKQVANEIGKKWPEIQSITIIQRIGHLEPLTPTVIIACSAAHRDSGIFEASRYGIDRLKEIVPIWKKEIGPDGETWVEGDYIPTRED
jgi:molybdopterin converting factor subunit 1